MNKLTIAICAFGLLAAGCAHHRHSRHPHGMPPGQAKKVVHVHGHACGHVHVGGEWVLGTSTPGHSSKNGKGHKN